MRSRIRKSLLIGQGSRRQTRRRRSRAAPNGCLARRTNKNLSLPWSETTMEGGSSSAARAAIAGTMGIRAGDSASAHGGRSHAVTSDERAVYDYDGVLQVPRSRRRVSGACRLAQYRHRAVPRHGHLARAVPTAGVPDPFFEDRFPRRGRRDGAGRPAAAATPLGPSRPTRGYDSSATTSCGCATTSSSAPTPAWWATSSAMPITWTCTLRATGDDAGGGHRYPPRLGGHGRSG